MLCCDINTNMANNMKEAFLMAKDIDSIITNFKKDGPSRKTLAYFESKKKAIMTLEKSLLAKDTEVRQNIQEPGVDYDKTIETAKNLLKWIQKTINEKMALIKEFHTKNPGMNLISMEVLKNYAKTSNDNEDGEREGGSFFC